MLRLFSLSIVLGLVLAGPTWADDADINADEAILRGVKVPTDGPGLLEFFKQRVPSEANQKTIAALIEQLANRKFREREQALTELLRIGLPARPFLIKAQQHTDIEVRRRVEECLTTLDKRFTPEIESAAVRVLRARRPAGTSAILLAILPAVRDPDVEEEIQAALLAVGLKDGKADDAVVKALRDPEASRRVAAVLVVGRSGSQPQREQVRQLLRNDSEMLVKLRAAQGLIGSKDVKAVAALLPLLTEAPLDVAEQARDLLAAVAGDKGPARLLSDDRPKCRAEWETWWKENEAKLDLARVEDDLPGLGLNRRGRRIAELFFESMVKGNMQQFRKVTDVPFNLAGSTRTTRAELDAFGAHPRKNITFRLSQVSDLESYFRGHDDPAAKTALQQLRPREIRVVWYHYPLGMVDRTGVVFVRLRNGQGQVIGITEPVRKR